AQALKARGRELPLEHVLQIVIGVCAGLDYAHEKTTDDGRPLGIVHRDVSPHNVIVTLDGNVKVLDFGIATMTGRVASSKTRSNQLRGTLPYMSPEQCRAEVLDRRSDLFSVGVLLWELSVGARLFSAASDLEILKLITEYDAALPSALKPEYPPE